MKDTGNIGPVVRRLDDLTDAELLEVHRIVSRRATLIRQRDPVYVQNQRMGYELSRSQR